MKTHLSSHVFPLHVACEILGHDLVRRLVDSLLRLRDPSNSANDTEILVDSMFYDDSTDENRRAVPPPTVTASWKQLWTSKTLLLDKASIGQWLVPHVLSGSHLGLIDCWLWALGGGPTLRLPDVLIFLAVCH